MRVCVFGAAPAPDRQDAYVRIARGCDAVIAADAGALACLDIGIVPALTVGDFDSAGPDGLARILAAGVPVERHPAEKDASDLDLAVAAALGMGADSIVVTAAFGDRVDHTLAAFGTLLSAKDVTTVAEEPEWSAHVAGLGHGGRLTLRLPTGTAVSVFAPSGASGVRLEGVRYPLEGASLAPLSSLGVSNLTTDGPLVADAAEGALIVIVHSPA